ncbi:nischarin-like isoform X2 [Acanthaster planci]|uniref:Nischarin-like isoform X2 n=1 Tax=Acanthaster planci TaxID=133434 RepID=A0A8B7ZDD3_ACAPL|nr:nischarin-like isoform X2 [Acanthaster planci]
MMAYSYGGLINPMEQVSLKREVRIVATKSVDNYTAYVIELSVSDCSWTIQRRYSEFHDLHEKLVALKKVERALLPPKKLLWNQSKSFVEKRRQDLESYLQKMLDQSSYLPTPLLHFLEFDIYDIYGVSQALATELFEKAEAILASSDVCEMTPMQLYAITERLKLAVPTCSADDARSDIGHIMDFISRLKLMRIVGSRHRLGSSTRVVDKLPFDLSPFRALEHLQVDVCDISLIGGLIELKRTLHYLAVHHTVKSLKEILLPEGEHWMSAEAAATVAGPSIGHPMHIPTWKCISRADFRYNSLSDIDDSIKLLPNLTRLDLSHNKLTEVNNLQYLSEMTHLDLSHNHLMSLEGLHARLGNVTTLGLAANNLSSLRGLGKLYSLVHLDVSQNSIEHVVEVNHISNLPCIESLNLKDNPITSIMDYRTKILSLFQEQYTELTLDGQRTSQKEMDRVAIMKAIQKAKESKVKKLTRKSSPSRKKHAAPVKQAEIADPDVKKPSLLSLATGSASSSLANSQQSLTQPDIIAASGLDDVEYRAKVEEIRREGGEAWLSLLNEMQEEPDSSPQTTKAKGGISPKRGRSPKVRRKDYQEGARSRSKSPAQPKVQQSPQSPTMKISPKALLHCIFDELARHRSEGMASIPELVFNLRIYFQGPVLSTYGPRHRRQGLAEPEGPWPLVTGYLLGHMSAESQQEFVELLQGLTQGKVQLPSHIFPRQEDAAEVFACMLRVLGLKEQPALSSHDEPMEPTVDGMAQLKVNYDENTDIDQNDLGGGPSFDVKAEDSMPSPAILISEHPSPPVIKKHVQLAPPLIIPTYEDATLKHLTECNQQVGLQLSEPLQAITNMQASELVKYFHDSIAEISSEPERLTHMMWAGAIAFQKPSVEITACVMLSDRAVYVLTADTSPPQILSPPVDPRSHRRMKSDSSVKDRLRADSKGGELPNTAGFNGGRVLKHPHASGVLLTTSEDKDRKRVRCLHMLNLTDIVEVDVGLFDQKLRLTAETAIDTISLLTRNFQHTLSFLEWLMQVLPITSNKCKSPDRSHQATDPYKLHRAFTEEFLHPSSVKFSYPNDETINDLTYLIVAHINDPKISMDNTSILLYMLVYQVHASPLQGNSINIQEPLEDCERSQRTLVVTNKHLTLCREDHVSYPLPGFMKSLPDGPQYEILASQAVQNLRRLVVSDFASRDVTLVFEVMEVVVDITMEHYGSEEGGELARPSTPEVAWTLVLPSMEDRERLRKQLCHTWKEMHGQELSIQVNT